ncbi:MAG: beta-phosphoglucomutase family hydrolase [Arenicella sp.]|nr:beta-phosphoglucomutase family hydrolase [Arenicella sp.]
MDKPLFDAVIFDLDGVITQTALVHSAAWKNMFDQYLKQREKKYAEPYIEFSHKQDYLKYVDGKPRYEGVRSFLQSRNIELPYGSPEDLPGEETICGIGNQKNRVFNQTLEAQGVKSYESTVCLMNELKEKGIRIGVASSSKNAGPVLTAAGLDQLIETRVDGVASAELNLRGKPEPDIFTTACDNLGVTYDRTVVVEDAESGVQAGSKGNFGLVLGLARENNELALLRNGADIVAKDIAEVGYEGIQEWFRSGLQQDQWTISYHDYDQGKEKTRETLLTVGNGYLGTRGAMEEVTAGEHNYPGTYMAGLYNRLVSKVAGEDIENEDFVNAINWLPVNFKVDGGKWLDINHIEILEANRTLNMRNGMLKKEMVVRDRDAKQTRIRSTRIVSMHDPHLMVLSYNITPLNYSGTISVKSCLSGDHINAGVERYKQLQQKHLKPVDSGHRDGCSFLSVATTQSEIQLSAAAMHRVRHNEHDIQPELINDDGEGIARISFDHLMNQGDTLTINKICSVYKSDDKGISDPAFSAISTVLENQDIEKILGDSTAAWNDIWTKIDIQLEGDRLAQKLLRLHMYHLLITTSPHNQHIDFGIPARGLHGEAYRGHIFWDELYILPFYNLHFPEIAKSIIMYRYRRLEEARKYAEAHGYDGAMFPWQSGSSGREETQVLHLNPVSGKWGPDHSSLQRHVSLAIAYNVWNYYWYSDDLDFMASNGAEMLAEICKFWASSQL